MLGCCINIDDEHDTPASSSCCSTLLNIDSSGPAKNYGVCNLLKGWDYTIYLIVGVPTLWHLAAYPVSELFNSLPSTNAELFSLQYAEGVGLHYLFNSVNPPLLWHFASYPVSELVNSLPSTNAVQSYVVCNMQKRRDHAIYLIV